MKPKIIRSQSICIYLFIIFFFGVIFVRQSYGQQLDKPFSTSLSIAVEAGVSLKSLFIQPNGTSVIQMNKVSVLHDKMDQRLLHNGSEDTHNKRRWWIAGGAAVLVTTTMAILLSSGGSGTKGSYIPAPPGRP